MLKTIFQKKLKNIVLYYILLRYFWQKDSDNQACFQPTDDVDALLNIFFF